MTRRIQFTTITLLFTLLPLYAGLSHASRLNFGTDQTVGPIYDVDRILKSSGSQLQPRADAASNKTSHIWLPFDEYSGSSFFDRWNFFTGKDPTNGMVEYVNRDTAFGNKLVYTQDDGVVIMKADNKTWLDRGVYRKSVRISSQAQYQTGLFILDLDKVPWGCGTWPAFWTLGNGKIWPAAGEIDIIEGVHDNEHNQVAWHTNPGCKLTPNATFSGEIVSTEGKQHLECNGLINNNAGCGVTEWSRASYGPEFDRQGGGVFAMKWDEEGIAVWSFYRPTVPKDIVNGSPDPRKWGMPSALLLPDNCPIGEYFENHSIIFDITFCGDWAGNSYATSKCPGTCDERLQDPANFDNAIWIINWLKVYRKQIVVGELESTATSGRFMSSEGYFWIIGAFASTLLLSMTWL